MNQAQSCIQCGAELSQTDNFCVSCGKVIDPVFAADEGSRSWASGSDFNSTSFFNPSHLQYLYLSSKGRINRQRYLFALLLLSMALGVLAYATRGVELGASEFLVLIIFYVPLILLSIKRVHDINRSGYFTILFFLPLVNGLAILCLLFPSGTYGSNKYGDDPRKYKEAE